MPGTEMLEIKGLGQAGDGIADTADGLRFIAGALPGERGHVDGAGSWSRSGPPSPDRRGEPLCPHVARCGGCSVQHMSDDLYRRWKSTLLPDVLATQGLQALIHPMLVVPAGKRRRAVLAATREADGAVQIGFHGFRSHAIEPIRACAVLVPDIVTALPSLAAIGAVILRGAREARVTVIATPHGLDVDFDIAGRRPTAEDRTALSRIAAQSRLARLSIRGDAVVTLSEPYLAIAGIDVVAPPSAFVQAVAEAETALQTMACAALGKAKSVADLFSGLGTFSLAMARTARVLAIDSDKSLILALQGAQKKAQGLKPIETRVRDLFHDPLSPPELAGLDAVLFDPPRGGAKAQAVALARSKVRTVIAVSCNPATLARDLRILVDGGFRLEHVTPVDQFLFTPHLEALAVLRR